MHCRIDPPPPLTEQYVPPRRRDSVCDGVWRELHLECREMLHHERREVSVLSEREEVLLVQSVDIRLGIFVDHD